MRIHEQRARAAVRVPAVDVNASRPRNGQEESEIQQQLWLRVPQRRCWWRYTRAVRLAHSLHAGKHVQLLSIGMSGNPLSGGFNLEVSKGALSNPGTAAQVSSNGFQATHTTWHQHLVDRGLHRPKQRCWCRAD